MKKMITGILLALVLLAAAVAACWYNRERQHTATHVTVAGVEYPVYLDRLDMRGEELSPEAYEELHRALPSCEILWDVPFQGASYPSDTTEITVSSLTMEDLDILAYLPELKVLDARQCRNFAVLEAWKQLRPDCQVLCRVVIGQKDYDPDVAQLSVNAQEGEDFLNALPMLTGLKTVRFADGALEAQALLELRKTYPDVSFSWEKTVLGTAYPDSVTELDFSGMELPPLEELEADMAYFPDLQKLILCECEVDNEAMAAFRDRVRDKFKVVWTVTMGKVSVPSDVTALMPYLFGYTGESYNEMKAGDFGPMKYLEDLVCLDLGHMQVKDISFVKNMPNLEYLLLADTEITDISPLAGLQKLKFLEIFYNDITDVSALAQCPALEDVNMCHNKVTDITPLLEMKSLKNLWLSGLYLTQEQMDQLKAAYPEAHIEFFVSDSVGKGWRKLPNYYNQRDLLGVWYLD